MKIRKGKINKEEFIEDSYLIHGDKYDYSKVYFVNKITKVIILCKTHGEFQQTPSNHLQGKGCTKCGIEKVAEARKLTEEGFIKKSREKHGDRYNYVSINFIDASKKVSIECSIHGVFEQNPITHMSGSGCIHCARDLTANKLRKTLDTFVREAKELHKDKFDYSKVNYINDGTKIIIGCPTHGDIEIVPYRHLKKYGCHKCGNKEKKGGFSRGEYVKKANGRICTFYTIRCFNKEESFYKIGITMEGLTKRYNTTERMPYNYEIISEVFGEAGFIWDLEKAEKRKLKEFSYSPKIDFPGSKTECFTQYKL
jgi:hypothetical protein